MNELIVPVSNDFGKDKDEFYGIPYIDFDLCKVRALKESYEENIKFILTGLPCINWNSADQVKALFLCMFDITLENVRIDHVLSHLEEVDHDSPAFDAINGFVLYLKLKYSLKNYINCILRHEENGRVYLRLFKGQWVLPNRQPPSLNPEITECIVAQTQKENSYVR